VGTPMSHSEHSYSSGDVARMLNISKSTLYRWERKGKVPSATRDLRGHRRYTAKDLTRIAQQVIMEPLGQRIHRLYESDDPATLAELRDLTEEYSLQKFLTLNDETGLYELGERPRLKPRTTRLLLRASLRYQPDDEVFQQIMRTIYPKLESLVGEAEPSQPLDRRLFTAQLYSEVRAREVELENTIEMVTHELQVRLQGAVALVDNLQRALSDPTSTRSAALESARETSRALMALGVVVRNMGSVTEDYEYELYPIADLVETSRDVFQAEALRKHVSIDVDLQPIEGRSPVIGMSKAHLQLALNNLLQNAVKYSQRGSATEPGHIRIMGRPIEDSYSIEISNLGVGILPDEQDKIFDPGYRGREAQRQHRTGTGVGLSVARSMVEMHQGKLSIRSQPVKSAWRTTVRVVLPMKHH
jgi:signal transduction histidine kinase